MAPGLRGSCKIGLAAVDAMAPIGEQLKMHALESIGEKLNAARRQQGFSIDEIVEQTRIGKHYIAALEQNDYAIFPGEFYALSFLRQYSDALELASEDLVNALRQELAEVQAKPKEFSQQPIAIGFQGLLGAAHGKIRRWMLEFVADRSHAVVAGALVLVGVVGWWYVGQSPRVAVVAPADRSDSEASLSAEPSAGVTASDAPEPAPVRSATPASPSVVPPVAPARSTPAETLAVELQASAEVWVRTVVDGGSPQEAILQAGNRRAIQAQERVQFSVGNAGAIILVVDGQVQDALGTLGQVRHIQVERDGWKALPSGSF